MLKSLFFAIALAAIVLGGASLLRAGPAVSNAKWEYKSLFLSNVKTEEDFSKILNDLAADGWEYDGSLGVVGVFRRAR